MTKTAYRLFSEVYRPMLNTKLALRSKLKKMNKREFAKAVREAGGMKMSDCLTAFGVQAMILLKSEVDREVKRRKNESA